jgi:hypothetical protein
VEWVAPVTNSRLIIVTISHGGAVLQDRESEIAMKRTEVGNGGATNLRMVVFLGDLLSFHPMMKLRYLPSETAVQIRLKSVQLTSRRRMTGLNPDRSLLMSRVKTGLDPDLSNPNWSELAQVLDTQ